VRIGIHSSTAGSLERAAIHAHDVGANTLQIFSASPRMWRAKTPDTFKFSFSPRSALSTISHRS